MIMINIMIMITTTTKVVIINSLRPSSEAPQRLAPSRPSDAILTPCEGLKEIQGIDHPKYGSSQGLQGVYHCCFCKSVGNFGPLGPWVSLKYAKGVYGLESWQQRHTHTYSYSYIPFKCIQLHAITYSYSYIRIQLHTHTDMYIIHIHRKIMNGHIIYIRDHPWP